MNRSLDIIAALQITRDGKKTPPCALLHMQLSIAPPSHQAMAAKTYLLQKRTSPMLRKFDVRLDHTEI
jgi:hypothetical protein